MFCVSFSYDSFSQDVISGPREASPRAAKTLICNRIVNYN